ncbi:lantibiotic dehydratase [Aquimarina sp. 2201CG1-2-11]|uniref:lantibiotic dehydratase n=1 Tax=Aquimarina discodermiae TaxID=3231043 RepID=UPI0034618A55
MKNIKHINEAILREPSYDYSKYAEIPDSDKEVAIFVKSLFEDDFFKQALFLASPQLYQQWKKSIVEDNWSDDKKSSIHRSIIKYYIRISTRCTPFGLFSNYTNIPPEERIQEIDHQEGVQKYASIDLLFLYAVVNALNKNHVLRSVLKYTPNNSMYKIGENYRYVEVSYKHTKRFHGLTSLESDEIIELIFSEIQNKPITIKELGTLLFDAIEGVTYEDVVSYIHSLIDAQIITSDLDIGLNESSPIVQLVSFLERHLSTINEDNYLQKVYNTLKALNEKIDIINEGKTTLSIDFYKDIFKIADALEISYEKQFLININLRKNHVNETQKSLTPHDYKLLHKAIETLSLFSAPVASEDSKLSNFKKAFYEKYEEAEVSLTTALDNELGVDYKGNDEHFNAFSTLIDDIIWEGGNVNQEEIKFNRKQHTFWNTLFHKSYIEGKKAIDLSKEDLSAFEPLVDELPTTFSAMVSKVNNKLLMHSVGDNALNMIGRFTNLDERLTPMVTNIIEKEKKFNPNSIQAEFIHLPNDRDANILARKINRDIEIPFLSKQSNETNSILLSDLYISLYNNRFILRSKTHNKIVNVYNSNAHNYKYDSLPVYEFLCDLQFDSKIRGLGLNIGGVNVNCFKFFPRVTYGEEVILSPATWKLNLTDLEGVENKKTGKFSFVKFEEFKKKYDIPRYVYLAEGDNQLLIDTKNEFLTQYIFEVLKKNERIVLIEVFDDLSKPKNLYANEYIVPFVNEKEREHLVFDKKVEKDKVQRKFIPGDEWLYYKIYCGIKSADIILSDIIAPLIEELKKEQLIEKWFFIRFNDPDFHLRIRFKYNKNIAGSIDKIATCFKHYMKSYVDNHFINKIELSTYIRELERYGGDLIDEAETIFHYDSDMVMYLVSKLRENRQEKERWVLSLKAIDGYLRMFKLSSKEKLTIAQGLYSSFQKEFSASKNMRKQIDKKFRLYKDDIIESMKAEENEYAYIINARNRSISDHIEKLLNVEKRQLVYFLNSFIHMTINRIAISNPRMHELVLYGLLEKFYRVEVYQKNKPEIIY